jgi:cell fate regulator YaaT (PSP1 superfamily)
MGFPDEASWELDEAPVGPAIAATAEPVGDDGDEGEAPRRPPNGESLLEERPLELDPDGDDELADLPVDEPETRGVLQNVALVCLHERTRLAEFDVGEQHVACGEQVVVETDQGLALGVVRRPCRRWMAREPLRRLVRSVDSNDQRQQLRNRAREREAFEYCRARVRQRQLPMKLIRVEYLHGGNKAIFYFAAESRVDFRDLVKDLAQRFHTRIVMRQVGVRDESKMTGGIGSCGCELCCATWLPDFEPVSIRMAKDQNLVLNPQKVSGQCGRLKCCLNYEQRQYHEARKQLPKAGRRVVTPDGEGKVQELDVLRRLVRVYRDDGTVQTYSADQLSAVDPTRSSEPAREGGRPPREPGRGKPQPSRPPRPPAPEALEANAGPDANGEALGEQLPPDDPPTVAPEPPAKPEE